MNNRKADRATTKQERTFRHMTPDLQGVAKECKAITEKLAADNLVRQYDLGAKAHEVMNDEGKYGGNAVVRLGQYLSFSPSYLYEVANITVNFERSEILHLAKRRMANGASITLSHFTILSRVDATKRPALMARIFERGLSSKALIREVTEDGLIKITPTRGGSKPRKPISALAGVQEITTKATALNNRFPVWSTWMDAATPPDLVASLMRPAPDELLVAYPTNSLINMGSTDDERCLEPAVR